MSRSPPSQPNLLATPPHLKAGGRRLWSAVLTTHDLTPAELELLRLAAEALDSAEAAHATVAKEGMTYTGRFGGRSLNPAVFAERSAVRSFCSIMAQLKLPTSSAISTDRRWQNKWDVHHGKS